MCVTPVKSIEAQLPPSPDCPQHWPVPASTLSARNAVAVEKTCVTPVKSIEAQSPPFPDCPQQKPVPALTLSAKNAVSVE
jgi:hypothetical protein